MNQTLRTPALIYQFYFMDIELCTVFPRIIHFLLLTFTLHSATFFTISFFEECPCHFQVPFLFSFNSGHTLVFLTSYK